MSAPNFNRRAVHHRIARFSPTAIFGPPTTATDDPFSILDPVPPTLPTETDTQTVPTVTSATTTPTVVPSPTTATTPTTSSTTTTTSTTSTSTSTTTTTSTSTSSSTSTKPTPVTTLSPTPTPTPTLTPSVTTQTYIPVAASTTSLQTPTPTSSKALNTAPIIGGLAGGSIALAALVFLVLFFVRHWRKRSDPDDFSAGDFRRSAILMDDPPTHSDTVTRGYNPRPPTMIERKLAHASPAYIHQHQQQQPQFAQAAFDTYGPYAEGGYETPQQYYNSSFGPGQVMPPTPNSADPLYVPTAFAISRSPSSSGPSSPLEQAQFARQPSNAAYLTRQPSSPTTAVTLTRQASTGVSARAHYVDLSRSSVTPFQAAQYADISRSLNTEAPGPMPEPQVVAALHSVSEGHYNEEAQGPPSDDSHSLDQHLSFPAPPAHDLPPLPPSPFADPIAPHADDYVRTAPPSEEEHDTLAPPDPARTRIDSTPPMLPEIALPQRAFSPSFSSRGSYDFPASVTGKPSPSPFAMEFGNTGAPTAPAKTFQSSPLAGARPDTVYTLYDPDDAYGGI